MRIYAHAVLSYLILQRSYTVDLRWCVSD